MGSRETATPGIVKSPNLRGSRALIASAIVTSYVLFEPAVCLQTVQDRAILGPPAPGTGGNQLGESIIHVLKSLNLSLDVSDLHLRSFPHAHRCCSSGDAAAWRGFMSGV